MDHAVAGPRKRGEGLLASCAPYAPAGSMRPPHPAFVRSR
jgi:hypothetical protein